MSDDAIRRLERSALAGDDGAIRRLAAIAQRNLDRQQILETAFPLIVDHARATISKDTAPPARFVWRARLLIAALQLSHEMLGEEGAVVSPYTRMSDMAAPIAAAHEVRDRLWERLYE